MISKGAIGIFLLKLAVAFPFVYAGIDGFIHPDQWIGFLPAWLPEFIPAGSMLSAYSLFELILGVWIIFARDSLPVVAMISAVLYAFITVINLGTFLVVFRDIGLALASAALAFVGSPEYEWDDEEDEY